MWARAPVAQRSDEVGQLAGALAHMIDAGAAREKQLKHAELAVRFSEQKFRSLIENVSDAVVLLDHDGVARYVSPAVRRLLDFAPREWVDRDPLPLVHPDDRDAFRAALASCAPVRRTQESSFLAGATSSVEVRMLRADGTVRIVDAALCNLLDDPTVGGLVVTLRDITERQRTLELKEAKEQAEEASRLKGQLLQNISHEFFTPMHQILGLTEMLLDSQPSTEQQADLEQVQRSANDLLGILTDILDFSSLESGKVGLQTVPLRPRPLVGEVVALWQARAQAKGLRLEGRVADDVPEVLVGDSDRLRQVLLHLVGNAIKFTDKGEVKVCVGVSSDQSSVNSNQSVDVPSLMTDHCSLITLHFQVRDTGAGIALEQRVRIFAPFVQADGSLTRRHGGTGLGLAIARSLVDLMGGRLWVESEPGAGSVFHVEIRLPVATTA
jgi:PAS domain S-box-containing protein